MVECLRQGVKVGNAWIDTSYPELVDLLPSAGQSVGGAGQGVGGAGQGVSLLKVGTA